MKPALHQVYRELTTKIDYKIVGHSKTCDNVFAIPIKNKKPHGMPQNFEAEYFSDTIRFRHLDYDPYKIDKREEDLTEAEKEIRDKRIQTIGELIKNPKVFNPTWRNQEIKFISKRTNGLKRSTIFNILKLAWMGAPDDNALIARTENCGGPGKKKNMSAKVGPTNNVPTKRIVLTPTDEEKIQKGFRKHYIKNSKNTLRAAYREFKADENFKEGEEPSLRQFIYWGQKYNTQYNIVAERAGKITEMKDIRTLHGTARDNVFGPYSEVMIDSTVDNVRAVQMSSPDKYFGRLTVYNSVDVFSGMVLAPYVTPEFAAYSTASLCVVNMAEDKVEFCKRFDVDITPEDWPCHYLPGRLLADRGELLSNLSSSLTTNLGIDTSNTGSGRAELKSYIEKQFHIYQSRIKGLLKNYGLIDRNEEPRITADSRKKAVLNMKDVTNLLIRETLHFNKYHWMADYPMTPEMRAEIKEPTPLNIFNWAISKGLGNLRRLEKHIVWRNALPRKECSVSRTGIDVKPHHFILANPDEAKILDQIRFRPDSKVEVAFHPSYFKETYLLHDGNFFALTPRGEIDYLNYFEFDDFVRDQSELKVIHDRELEKAAVNKIRLQKQRLRDAEKRRAKTVQINNAQEFRKEEIESHRESVMEKLKSPEEKAKITTEPSFVRRSKTPMPSFIEDLKNLNI